MPKPDSLKNGKQKIRYAKKEDHCMELSILFGIILSIQILDILYCLRVLRWYEKKKIEFGSGSTWNGFYIC